MAYYKGMCEFCKYSLKAVGSMFEGGWCDKFDKPIGKVVYEHGECIEQSMEKINENTNI